MNINEIYIKKAVKSGNSSAVVLPRAWLDKEVRIELVEKNDKIILYEVLEILSKNIDLKEITGIYLVGSYARGEQTSESDIDILVITKEVDREMISESNYNILTVSKKLLALKLENDLLPLGQMIIEARALLNSDYLESLNVCITKKNIKWYIDTTKEKLDIINSTIKIVKGRNIQKINGRVAYTLILRLRTIYILECIISGKKYMGADFMKLIRKINGINSYESYIKIKNNQNANEVGVIEIERLRDYLDEKLSLIMKKYLDLQ